jgi:hypothetical protein
MLFGFHLEQGRAHYWTSDEVETTLRRVADLAPKLGLAFGIFDASQVEELQTYRLRPGNELAGMSLIGGERSAQRFMACD